MKLEKPMCVICLREFEINEVAEQEICLIRCDDCLGQIPEENIKDIPTLESICN